MLTTPIIVSLNEDGDGVIESEASQYGSNDGSWTKGETIVGLMDLQATLATPHGSMRTHRSHRTQELVAANLTPFSCSNRKTWLVILGLVQILTCAGIVWGWNAFRTILVAENEKNPNLFWLVPMSKRSLDTIYYMGTSGNYIANVPFGVIYDTKGARTTSMIAAILLALGLGLMLLHILPFGFLFMSAAGVGVQMAVYTSFDSFPQHRGLLLQASTACYELSSLVFWLFEELYQSGLASYYELFTYYFIVPAAIFTSSALLFETKRERTMSSEVLLKDVATDLPHTRLTPWREEVYTAKFLFLTSCFCLQVMRINWAVGTLAEHLGAVYSPEEVVRMLNIYSPVFASGFLIAVPLGHYFFSKGPVTVLLGSILFSSLAQCGLLVIHIPICAYFTFLVLSVAKQLVFASCAGCVLNWYGPTRFGRYIGAIKFTAACFGYLNLAWSVLANEKGFFFTDAVLLVLLMPFICVLLIRPTYIFG